MKVLVGAFNQEKALVGAFSVIVKTGCGTDGAFYSTNCDEAERSLVQEILNNCTFLEADFAATLT